MLLNEGTLVFVEAFFLRELQKLSYPSLAKKNNGGC